MDFNYDAWRSQPCNGYNGFTCRCAALQVTETWVMPLINIVAWHRVALGRLLFLCLFLGGLPVSMISLKEKDIHHPDSQ